MKNAGLNFRHQLFSFSNCNINPNPTHLPKHQILSLNHQFSQRIWYVECCSDVDAHMAWTQEFSLTAVIQPSASNAVLKRSVLSVFINQRCAECVCLYQARNQGGRSNPRKFFAPLEKCVGHSLKILDIVQKIWPHLGKLFAPPGVQSWLRACFVLWTSCLRAKMQYYYTWQFARMNKHDEVIEWNFMKIPPPRNEELVAPQRGLIGKIQRMPAAKFWLYKIPASKIKR